MKANFASFSPLAGFLNMLHAHGSPLPEQGEGEGFSKTIRAGSGTPHLNPLPFFKGRGEKARVQIGTRCESRETNRKRFRPAKHAINQHWRE
jgi:hypothetical protein